MQSQNLYKTYFYIGTDEISIFVKNNENSEIVFSENQKIDKKFDNFDNSNLKIYFNNKIEEIEKMIIIFVSSESSAKY